MLIFLYGADTFRSRQKLNEIIGRYQEVHKSGLSLKLFDCQSADFADFKNELETVSMFKETKLIVLKNVFSSPQFEKSLLEHKKKLLADKNDTIVFFEDDSAPSQSPLFKFLKTNAKCQEFSPLTGLKLLAFAKKEIAALNAEIQKEALEELLIACGGDSWWLSNEIRKLAAFKSGGEISMEDVNLMVNSEAETNIFRTIDSIAQKNRSRALRLLHEHLGKGEAPLQILAMISYQFRNLLMIKSLLEGGFQYHLIAKKTGLHPFAVRKSYDLCQKFTLPELKKIYRMIFQVDLDIKTGKLDPGVALDLLITGI